MHRQKPPNGINRRSMLRPCSGPILLKDGNCVWCIVGANPDAFHHSRPHLYFRATPPSFSSFSSLSPFSSFSFSSFPPFPSPPPPSPPFPPPSPHFPSSPLLNGATNQENHKKKAKAQIFINIQYSQCCSKQFTFPTLCI